MNGIPVMKTKHIINHQGRFTHTTHFGRLKARSVGLVDVDSSRRLSSMPSASSYAAVAARQMMVAESPSISAILAAVFFFKAASRIRMLLLDKVDSIVGIFLVVDATCRATTSSSISARMILNSACADASPGTSRRLPLVDVNDESSAELIIRSFTSV
jgi:hypothetical protein